jgi:hypothetical protein
MPSGPIQVLQAAGARGQAARKPRLVIAGATGVLGNAVLRRLVGLQRFKSVEVLAREPITPAVRGVSATVVAAEPPSCWLPGSAEAGVILFDPPRLFYERERALWTPGACAAEKRVCAGAWERARLDAGDEVWSIHIRSL